MFSKGQYCFANISKTKARILLKFYMVFKNYLVSLSIKFNGDPGINARARVVNVRVHDLPNVWKADNWQTDFLFKSTKQNPISLLLLFT